MEEVVVYTCNVVQRKPWEDPHFHYVKSNQKIKYGCTCGATQNPDSEKTIMMRGEIMHTTYKNKTTLTHKHILKNDKVNFDCGCDCPLMTQPKCEFVDENGNRCMWKCFRRLFCISIPHS